MHSPKLKQFLNLSIFSFLLATLFYSCGSEPENTSVETSDLENNFEISGKIAGASMSKVSVTAQSNRGTIPVAETTTDANGNYTIVGNIPGLGIYSIMVSNNPEFALAVPLNLGDKVSISAERNEFATSPIISGTSWSAPLMRFMKEYRKFGKKAEQMSVEKDEVKRLVAFNNARKPLIDFSKSQILKDPGNPVNLLLVSELFPSQQLSFSEWDQSNLSVLEKMEKAYVKKFPNSPITQSFSQQIISLSNQVKSEKQISTGTMEAPEIMLPNAEGKSLSLSSLKGKVVLIDFWASWCGPCRKENPNVVRMYAKYKNQGFDIFSVSLDDDPIKWKEAISKDKLVWPNHVSDLKGWQSSVAKQYGVQAIPYTVLLNKEGKIIGTNLRGEKLEQKLLEALK
jgi:thiol-disulfide isomerase/thioredoxin